jgi:hypothetical protein
MFISVFAATLIAATPSWQSKASENGERSAILLFKSYGNLEAKQDYIHIYELLSAEYKKRLEKESRLTNATEYDRLRRSSEAQWSQFRIVKIWTTKGGLKLSVNARIEESGVGETVNSVYYLIRDHGAWKIDRWVY